MSWWNPKDWFRDVQDDADMAYVASLKVSKHKHAARINEESIAAKRRGLEATLEALRYAHQLDASDKDIAEVIKVFRDGVVDQTKMLAELVNQPRVKGALDDPFDGATSSETSSAPALPKAMPRALPNGTGHEPAEVSPPSEASPPSKQLPPPKRPRGRPRKYPRPGETGHSNGTTQ